MSGGFLALPIRAEFMSSVYRDDRWGSLKHERFEISDDLSGRMDCDDFRVKKPLFFRPFKALKEKGFFRRLFKRRDAKRERNPAPPV